MVAKTYTPEASFVDLLMDAVFAVDADAHVVFASAACERIFGYTPKEMIGKSMFDMMLPEDREITRRSVVEVMSGHPQLDFENRYVHKDGHTLNIMWATRWSPTEQLRIGVARDITAYKRAESMQAVLYSISEAAHAAEDLLALIQRIHEIVGTLLSAENFSVGLYDTEADRLSFPYHVDQHEPMPEPSKLAAGSLCAEIIRSGQALLLNPDSTAWRPENTRSATSPNPLCWLGVPLKSQKGTFGVLIVKSYPGAVTYTEKDQELLQFVSAQVATVIERQQMQARLRHMARYDQLTSLPNRGFLYDRLRTALSSARRERERERLSLLYIDLDKFKEINDGFGHGVGDLLLQEVAKRLKHSVRESDTVARIGGDEFVVLLQRVQSSEQATWVAEKIRVALNCPFTIEGHSLTIVASIGIAHYPEHGDLEQQLLKYADQSMYAAKKSGRRR